MNSEVYIVDRVDEARWYVDTETASNFSVQLDNNQRAMRDWIRSMTQDTVVICGQGVLPAPGGVAHPTHQIYEHIRREQFKVYFKDDKDALAFKLAWGGSI